MSHRCDMLGSLLQRSSQMDLCDDYIRYRVRLLMLITGEPNYGVIGQES
jgi:hypothetical protein